MMLNDGDEILIRGRKATVCYTTKYNGEDYICVAFESDKIEYDIYKYKIEGEKLLVSNELSQDEIKNVLCIFVKVNKKLLVAGFHSPEFVHDIAAYPPNI